MSYEVHRNTPKAWTKLACFKTKSAAIRAAEALARSACHRASTRFGVYDTTKRHYIGFASSP